MWIATQDHEGIINIDLVQSIEITGDNKCNISTYYPTTTETICLGTYSCKDEAEKVLMEIFSALDGNKYCYLMPQDRRDDKC